MAESAFSECRPLFVDDDPNFFLPVQRCLTELGVPAAHAQFCPDGNAAIAVLSRKAPLPSVLILDHKMPRMTGLEVLDWVKARRSTSSLRVFMLSMSAEPKLVRRAMELGAEAWFVKPMSLEGLRETLGSILAHWNAGRQGEPVPENIDSLAAKALTD